MSTSIAGVLALTGALLVPVSATAAPAHAEQWRRVGTGITEGVSGLAVLSTRGGRIDAVSVVDNKKPSQDRVRRIVLERGRVMSVRTLTWQGELPIDLEAVTRIPGKPDELVALASAGRAFHVRVNGDAVSVIAVFDLPAHDAADNFESFALHAVGSRLAAVWADRGADVRPATVYSAYLSLNDHTFGPVTSVEYHTGANERAVRHASDIAITAHGSLLVSSTVDPGDDGPFSSSLREVGRLAPRGDTVGVKFLRRPRELGTFDGHKVEAVTCGWGRHVLLGTDDENDGGSVALR